MVALGNAKPRAVRGREESVWSVNVRPERATAQPKTRVQQADPRSYPDDVARKAEHERLTREPRGGSREVDPVRRATDHAVQDDDVSWLDRVRLFEDVEDAERRPALEPGLARELAGIWLIRWYELHDFPPVGTDGQELCLDATDATTDFQHPHAVQRAD